MSDIRAARYGQYTYVEYARYADDLVILVDGYRRHDWLRRAVAWRLREELGKLDLRLNEAKSRIVDLAQGEAFGVPGLRLPARPLDPGRLAAGVHAAADRAGGAAPEVTEVFQRYESQPIARVIITLREPLSRT